MYNRRLYPFSISQVKEKQLGFDFGYEVSKGNVFLAQYKRPCGKGKSGIMWEIKKEQAALLAKQPVRSFYVLPALFEPAKIRPKRVWDACDTEVVVFLAMGNVQNLQKEDNFYLIRYEGSYVVEADNASELSRRIRKYISVCTLLSEFDIEKEQPNNFEQGQALLTVLLQTYEECAGWLRRNQGKNEICAGELRAVGNQTDISILLFSLRGKPEKVYAFPTLRAIRNRLLQEFGWRIDAIKPMKRHSFLCFRG